MKALATLVLGVSVVLAANATPEPMDMPTGMPKTQERTRPRPNSDGAIIINSTFHDSVTHELTLRGGNLNAGIQYHDPEIRIGGFDVDLLDVTEDCVFADDGKEVTCWTGNFPLDAGTCYSVSLTNMGPRGREWTVESIFCTALDYCNIQICPQEGN